MLINNNKFPADSLSAQGHESSQIKGFARQAPPTKNNSSQTSENIPRSKGLMYYQNVVTAKDSSRCFWLLFYIAIICQCQSAYLQGFLQK